MSRLARTYSSRLAVNPAVLPRTGARPPILGGPGAHPIATSRASIPLSPKGHLS